MTEREAWLWLAEMWDKAVLGRMDMSDVEEMMKKIQALPEHVSNYLYKWSFDTEGAVRRAAWCRKQASLLSPLLTEKEAWLECARQWDCAAPNDRGLYYGNEGRGEDGICLTIEVLRICRTTSLSMRKKIRDLPKIDAWYCFPRDAFGAKMRADYCREQAALLDPPAVSADSPGRDD